MENWKRVSGILCDRRISLRVKECIKDSCKTSTDVRCRDVDSEEITKEEVGCGGNEDVKMDEWSWTELGMKELEGRRRWEKYPRKCRKVG